MPILADHRGNSLAVAIQDRDIAEGVYFVASGTTASQLLKIIGMKIELKKDFLLKDGMKLIINQKAADKLSLAEIENSTKIALGKPIDLNGATKEDLLLIPGIGEITAQKILALRSKKSNFRNIDELMEVEGIKEKRLNKLKHYFYLAK